MTSDHAPGDPGQGTEAEPWRRWTRRNLATAWRDRVEGQGERAVGGARGLSDSCRGGDRDWDGAQAGWRGSCLHFWRVSVVKVECARFLNKQPGVSGALCAQARA